MNCKPVILLSVIAMLMISFLETVAAQDRPGKKDSINSAILGQKRYIQVVLPSDYNPASSDKYDVIYVLDGDDNTKTVADVQQFIKHEDFMPQVIVVGILNIDRNKDLTPTHTEGLPTSGGADKFLAFLKNELIPYINKTYPSNGDNILFGHSFGGLFVTYALLNEPQTFKAYLAADPSYWWDKGYMIKEAANKLPNLANLNKCLFISGREGEALKGMAIPPMDTLLQKSAPKSLSWKISAYANETHGTVRLKSIYDGLRFIYDGYGSRGAQFHPMAGIMLKDHPIRIWDFDDDTTKVRYAINGTPTPASPNIKHANFMTDPGTFSATIFATNDKYNRTTTGTFKEGKPWSPVAMGKGFKSGRLHYAYYEGEWDKLPDFSKLKPTKEGLADKDFDVSKLPRQTNFGVVLSGQIEIKDDGYYVFGISSDDGSKVYLADKLILDNDGLHDGNDPKSYILPLKKGFYPIRLEYFQKGGGASLRLIYIKPDKLNTNKPNADPVPPELLYSGD